MQSLAGKVALVTGATRGIGKGIALQLAQNGAIVYITGRTLKPKQNRFGGSLEETREEIKKRGGVCIPVMVDHEVDTQVENLFKQINNEQKGRLDILVNSAFKGGEFIFSNNKASFWELDPVKSWDDINNVGLRNHYICTVHAARMMVPRKSGLIINITSLGGMQYAFNVPYGIGKAAVDRMSQDCGVELYKQNVCCLGLLISGVKTEFATQTVQERGDVELRLDPNRKFLGEVKLKGLLEEAESPEFAGKVIVALANDKKIMSYSKKIVIAADYAQAHNIHDIDDRVIPSHRSVSTGMKMVLPKALHPLANLVPNFVKVPQFVMDLASSKF